MGLVVIATLIASAAFAQQAPISEDLAWKLLEHARVVDPPKTAALFAPMKQKEPSQGDKTEREI
jgi:triacylglycerol lipase